MLATYGKIYFCVRSRTKHGLILHDITGYNRTLSVEIEPACTRREYIIARLMLTFCLVSKLCVELQHYPITILIWLVHV